MISKKKCPSSFCDVYFLWKLKNCICQTYYYIFLTYVSLKSHVDGIVLCVANYTFSCKEIATNHKCTIHLLFVCTWLRCLILILNCLLSFFCAYPVVLNLLVTLIMCFIILTYVIDYYCCLRLFNGYGAFYTHVVGNYCWLKYLARRWIEIE